MVECWCMLPQDSRCKASLARLSPSSPRTIKEVIKRPSFPRVLVVLPGCML